MSYKFPRIHPDTIARVQQATNIVEVISEYVVLRRQGREHTGLCPFHAEKTPSFSVNPAKGVYHCFGCGASGNSLQFLMEIGQQSFVEVVLDLAQRYQIPVETVEPEERIEIERQLTVREQLYSILASANNFFQRSLKGPALEYLRQIRELTPATIAQFQLGYAPLGWENLYRHLVEEKRFPVDLVLQAGLIKQRENNRGYYDLFRDRVIIPILDPKGRVIGFNGRALGDDKPKYLNSPETDLFDKSKSLFALDKAHKAIAKEDQAIVVEGCFDAIALYQGGIPNVVASLGTALTSYQVKQLCRYSNEIMLNFDGDRAGVKAATRAIGEAQDLVYSGVVQLKVLSLPDGQDGDEFIRNQGAAVYRQAVSNAPLWLDWQIVNLLQGKNLETAQDVQQIAKGMIELLSHLQDANQRSYYLNYCAEILSRGESRLVPQNIATLQSQLSLNQGRPKTQRQQTTKIDIASNPETEQLLQAESLLLLIYLHCPEQRSQISSRLEEKELYFSLSQHHALWQKIIETEVVLPSPELLVSQLRADLPPNFYRLDEKSRSDIFRASTRIDNAIASLEQVKCLQYQDHCSEQLKKLKAHEGDRIVHLYQEIRATKLRLEALARERLGIAEIVP